MPEGLPPHLTEEAVAKKAPDVFYHNWLYSVVPVDEKKEIWEANAGSYGQHSTTIFVMAAYLTGYCRNCGKAFSKRIEVSYNGAYQETIMNVPKEGCIGA